MQLLDLFQAHTFWFQEYRYILFFRDFFIEKIF